MPKVLIRKNQIRIGSQNIPLISGEVHYWRLNPSYWQEILKRVQEMGLKVIATYIPWDYHEHRRGQFDFTGKTDRPRNLKGFLELTRRMGFKVIIRPGPYIYSEWPNEGVPSYAYKYHRLHPQFLEYASEYIHRVCQVLKPYLASRKSGHIILLQADNEIDPWPDIFGHQYGLDSKPGLFQEFIRDLYHRNMDALNESWGTSYESFTDVRPFIATMFKEEPGLALKGDKELKRNIDYLKFKNDYSVKTARWTVDAYRQQGIDVPIYLNLYPFFYAHDWAEMQSVSDMVGIDLYPSSELSEDPFEQRKVIDKVRYLRGVSTIPYIAEFASGVWHARHYETGVLTPNHYRLLAFSALLGGVAGWNWYMLVNRDNWYMSPINEWGRVRHELYDVFKQIVKVFKEIRPPELSKLTEVAVTFNPIQHAARTLPHNSPILVSLYESDIDYELFDPRLGICKKKCLFYSGNQWLDTNSQRNLRSYVEKGGTLVAFKDYPRKDDRFQACSLAGFEEPRSILFEFKKKFSLQLTASRPKIEVASSVFTFNGVRGEKITADLGNYGTHTIGYIKRVGKGKIIHLGVDPSREIVMEILSYLGIPLICHASTLDIKTALFQRGSRYYLIAVNNGDEHKSANIHIPALAKGKKRYAVRDLLNPSAKVEWDRRRPMVTEISRKDGKVFEIRPR